MAITVTKKKETEEAEIDSLPEEEEVQPKDRTRELELELAEKKGELKALRNNASGNSPQLSHEQTKQIVFSDSNNLSDEDFLKKYKTSKHAAIMTVMDADNRMTKAEAKQLHAEAQAVSELGTELGSDFFKFKGQILENASDLAETARQDPEKLKRWMKSQYLALSNDAGERPSARKDTSRRKIQPDFEKPTVEADEKRETVNETDEIADEIPAESDISNQKLGRLMGITSEKERKELAGKNLIYVDMNLGDGWHFGDPKRGFEREKQKVA